MSIKSHQSGLTSPAASAAAGRDPIAAADAETTQLIQDIQALATELRVLADDNKALEKIKGNEELIQRIDEVLMEIEEQSDKLSLVGHTPAVARDIKALQAAMMEIQDFFVTLSKASMFASKHKLRLKMQNAYQSLRGRCTQLMTAVSLELLTKAATEPMVGDVSSALAAYRAGLDHYWGIGGKAKNATLALEKFTQGAEGGDLDAMVMLGKCYNEGQGVEASFSMAIHWLERAIAAGVRTHAAHAAPHAKTALAKVVLEKLKASNPSVVQEYFTASPPTRMSSGHWEDGSSKQHSDAGNDDELADYDMAVVLQLVLEAAQDGHAEAQAMLGMLYEEGQDLAAASKWYSLASNAGSAHASFLLAEVFFWQSGSSQANRSKAWSLYTMAVRNGHVEGHYGLGMCHELGLAGERGTMPSVPLAMHHYALAARAGHAMAMYSLGYLMVKAGMERRDINRDHMDTDAGLSDGIHWLRAAAENRIADASFQLGRLYEQGIGLPEDLHSALSCYCAAANMHELGGSGQMHAKAAYYAANLLYSQADHHQAMHFYKLACQADVQRHLPEAFNNYALLLEDSIASTPNTSSNRVLEAAAYYHQAVLQAYPPAYANLLLLIANHHISSFHDLQGNVIKLSQLLPVLADLNNDASSSLMADEEKLQAYQALLESVQRHHPFVHEEEKDDQRDMVDRHHSSPIRHREKPQPVADRPPANLILHNNVRIGGQLHAAGSAPLDVSKSLDSSIRSHNQSPSRQPSQHQPLVKSGEVYMTRGPIAPPHYVPKAQLQSVPLSAADKKPSRVSSSPGRRDVIGSSPGRRDVISSSHQHSLPAAAISGHSMLGDAHRSMSSPVPLADHSNITSHSPSATTSNSLANRSLPPLPPAPAAPAAAVPPKAPAWPSVRSHSSVQRTSSAPASKVLEKMMKKRPTSVDLGTVAALKGQAESGEQSEEKKRNSLWSRLKFPSRKPKDAVGIFNDPVDASNAADAALSAGPPPALH